MNNDMVTLAARLRAAREACGLTQQAVAERLGVSRPLVIGMEKGTRPVSPDELITLASLYGRSLSELLRSSPPVEAIGVQFRAAIKGQSDANVLQTAVAQLERLADDYLELARLAEVHLPRRYPEPVEIKTTAIDHVAEELATTERYRLGLGDGPVHRLRDLLDEEVGLRVFAPELPSGVAGLFAYLEPLGGVIAVNAVHPRERQYWTLAHEYAHFLTDRHKSEITALGWRERQSTAERFADAFAANFLMPRNGLVRRFNDLERSREGRVTPADLLQLARTYMVSLQAIMYRCEDLKLLPSGTHERLTERGFQVEEARRLLGIPEVVSDTPLLPMRYKYLAMELYEQGEISEGELASFLRCDRVSARRLLSELGASSDVSRSDGVPVRVRWVDVR